MKGLLNIRYGFATNSSSSHSIIIRGSAKGRPSSDEFGWDNFVQSSKVDKRKYAASQLFNCINDHTLMLPWAKKMYPQFDDTVGSVDHQSVALPPIKRDGSYDLEFLYKFWKAVVNDDTAAIEGGNDNGGSCSGTDHDKWESIFNCLTDEMHIRKNGDYYTLFDKAYGTKVHVSLLGCGVSSSYRPDTPELVDLKITNYCERGCKFCYQNSSCQGKHGDIEQIEDIIKAMSDAQVFEVAIGGGEPTTHPKFAHIIKLCSDNNIIPNFTTRNLAWITGPFLKDIIKEYKVGGIGYSVDTVEDVEELMNTIVDNKVEMREYNGGPKLSIHWILGLQPVDDIYRMVAVLDKFGKINQDRVIKFGDYVIPIPDVLFLGYKSDGRGGVQPYPATGWNEKIGRSWWSIGVDTAVIKQYPREIAKLNVDRSMYYKEEGRFSMYIDAVDMKCGKASFGTELTPIKDGADAMEQFKSWRIPQW